VKVGIVGHHGGWHTAALRRALSRRGLEPSFFDITRLTARVSHHPWLEADEAALESFDLIFVRLIPGGSLEQIIFRVDALHRLENAGVRVINSATAIERTVDKYYTSALLEDAGIPTPRTVVAEHADAAMEAFHHLGGDVVVKPLFGSEGRGMVRVTDPDVAHRVFRALDLGRYVYYLQAFLPHNQEDIRVFVIGDRAIAAMARRGDTWKTNVARGAVAAALPLDLELENLSRRAARAVEAQYAGVDLLHTIDGRTMVIEVNGIPGWKGLQGATGIDFADHLVGYALQERDGAT
jgi:RimK family alpha-L-glutamate ligase